MAPEEDSGIEFTRWETPFEDIPVELLEVRYSPVAGDGDCELHVKVGIPETDTAFDVMFEYISGFRVLDEGGLLWMWGRKGPEERHFVSKIPPGFGRAR